MNKEDRLRYWKKNLSYLLILLTIWFTASFILGIIFVDYLDGVKRTSDGVVEDSSSFFHGFRLGGFKLGFWIAQQGAIYIFLIIIALYVWLMNKLDKEFNIEEKEISTSDH
tara:strand:- start:33327 stop:33659 length:333 start_codon:yes stop_codon:yes gene_type:complete